MHRLQELVRLHRLDTRCREVARLLGMSPNTERAYREALQAAKLLAGDPKELPELVDLTTAVAERLPLKESPQYVSSVEQWRPQIAALFRKGAKPKAIFDRLKLDEPTFDGTLSAVKRMVEQLRRAQPVRAKDVVIPVETVAGHIAQVDFGYVGKLLDESTGRLRKAWVFVMTLAHSRHMFADIVFDQCGATWQRVHVSAFEHFGGVPATVVPDNLKAAVILAAFGLGDEPSLNRTYRELARHYGFKIDPAPARKPEKKGKVESDVGYVKGNYFATCTDNDAQAVRAGLHRWVTQIAGQREHGTTRRVPLTVFEQEERPALLSLPKTRYEPVTWHRTRVYEDAHVLFDRRFYSVPWTLLGKQAWVRATASTVVVYVDDERVSTHDRRGKGPRSTNEAHLPEVRRDLRHRDEAWWLAEADEMAAEVGALMREVLASDRELSLLPTVQAMVLHLRKFPVERARRACLRASRFGNHSYQGLRDMLLKGLDFEPLPDESDSLPEALTNPVHARDLRALLGAHMAGATPSAPHSTEATHELN